MCGFDSHFIVCLRCEAKSAFAQTQIPSSTYGIAIFDTKIVILDVEIQIWQNQLWKEPEVSANRVE